MGLMNKLKGELVDIIEWMDDSHSTLAWRFPRYNNEIKNGAQLIVREGQRAVFVYRGALADNFDPGPHELTTENLPILSTLQGWKHGFNSPFRSEVYFINTRPVTDLRWGTSQPVTVRDPDFGMVQVRANGLCVVKIANVETFLKQVIGTHSDVEADEIAELLRRVATPAFAPVGDGAGCGGAGGRTGRRGRAAAASRAGHVPRQHGGRTVGQAVQPPAGAGRHRQRPGGPGDAGVVAGDGRVGGGEYGPGAAA